MRKTCERGGGDEKGSEFSCENGSELTMAEVMDLVSVLREEGGKAE